MDAITLTVAAGAYVAAALAKKMVDVPLDKALNKAFDHIVSTLRAKLGRKPGPKDFNTTVVQPDDLQKDPQLIKEVDSIFKFSSALRRARLVEEALKNARLLWVDDVPENVIYEQQVLRAFGVEIESVLTTDEAMVKIGKHNYDLVVSDMARHGQSDAGLQLLNRIRKSGKQTPIVYYVGSVDLSRGTPVGAFGIADYPEPLLHYVFDVLERTRL
jgi:CheY-like chemotaxis protein